MTAACLAELGLRGRRSGMSPSASRSSSRARCLPRAGARGAPEGTASGFLLTLDVADVFSGPHQSPSAAERPPPTRATPTSRRSHASSTSLPEVESRVLLVMKSTVPVGTGELSERARRSRAGARGYVSNPEFLAEGTAIHDFTHPDWASPLGPSRRPTRMPWRPLRAARRAECAGRRRVGGDDQARLERLPGDPDQLHQRDRERLRGDRRRRRQGRRGHRARPSARAALPAPIGYGGSCFPKDSLALAVLGRRTRATTSSY